MIKKEKLLTIIGLPILLILLVIVGYDFIYWNSATGDENLDEPFIRIAPEGTVFETFADQAYYQGFTEDNRISENCYQTEKRQFCQNEDGSITLSFSVEYELP